MSLSLFLLVSLGAHLGLAYLTSKDARKRGHDGRAWALFVVVAGLVGIVVYLLARDDRFVPEHRRRLVTNVVRAVGYGGGAILYIVVLVVAVDAVGGALPVRDPFLGKQVLVTAGLLGPVAVYAWRLLRAQSQKPTT